MCWFDHSRRRVEGVNGQRSPQGSEQRVPRCARDDTPNRSLHLDRGALLFELGLDLRGLVLRDAGLHGLRRAIDHVLGFLEAKTGDLANDLDDLDLLATGILEK